MDGPDIYQGRVEVFRDGVWGTICDDNWDDQDAHVVCSQLGHEGGLAVNKAEYGKGDGPILLDEVECEGTETSLIDCVHRQWGEHNCVHLEDAGVQCGKLLLNCFEI